MILAIDPGTSCIGWALIAFDKGILTKCGLLRWNTLEEFHDGVYHMRRVTMGPMHMVCEIPQIYRQRNWKGDPNDLIDVAVSAGLFLGAMGGSETTTVKPHAWKGSTPKKIHTDRIVEALSPQEFDRLQDADVPASLRHNVVDAIGLGKWFAKKGST